MQTGSYQSLELIGQGLPVDFVESKFGIRAVLSLCKYSKARGEYYSIVIVSSIAVTV